MAINSLSQIDFNEKTIFALAQRISETAQVLSGEREYHKQYYQSLAKCIIYAIDAAPYVGATTYYYNLLNEVTFVIDFINLIPGSKKSVGEGDCLLDEIKNKIAFITHSLRKKGLRGIRNTNS